MGDMEKERTRKLHDMSDCEPLDNTIPLGNTAIDWVPLYPCHPRRRRDLKASAGLPAEKTAKLPELSPWKPGHWAAGRLMGPPPLANVDAKVLASRVATLQNG